MTRTIMLFCRLTLVAYLLAAGVGPARAGSDSLFVGDGIDDHVEVFDARTGSHLRSLDPAGLLGPRGIAERFGSLFLVNQNVDTDFTGEVLRFNSRTGMSVTKIVPADTPDAPYAPRGMVLWRGQLFVANAEGPPVGDGDVRKYTVGGILADVLVPPAQQSPSPSRHPFAVVIGPSTAEADSVRHEGRLTDRRTSRGYSLYVSSRFSTSPTSSGGQILEFDPESGDFIKVFISNDGTPTGDCTQLLTRPEGIVFGPDGRLYVTSARSSVADSDRILIFEGPTGRRPGRCVGRIDLDQPNADNTTRSTAQTLLFGPRGDLFVPISNAFAPPDVAAGKDRGAVRRYRVVCRPAANEPCFGRFVDNLVAPGGQLGQGWYLTFGKTRPGTLAYGG